jgi:hypothetical protein
MGNLRKFKRSMQETIGKKQIGNRDEARLPIIREQEEDSVLEDYRRDCEAAPGRIKIMFLDFVEDDLPWVVGKDGIGVGFYPYDSYRTFEEAQTAYPDAFISASAKREIKRLKTVKSD